MILVSDLRSFSQDRVCKLHPLTPLNTLVQETQSPWTYPSRGGVSRQEDEVIKRDGGEVIYTSTDERGNFRIGDGVVINQTTGTISGRDYSKSLFSQITPFILALGD